MKIKVYGTDWCPKTGLQKNHLQSEWIDFEFYNVEQDEEAANYIRGMYNGKLKFPVIVIDDKVMLNPTIEELNKAIAEKG